ncbi:MAG: agmatine deiminase family protein [Candidatus Schekmanbacteria bacterium]|nr:agmatine deiminase family protein [Candidatus Schekmanbacteria bacterium]
MPAEWERHSSIWLSWPHDPITFPDRIERAEEIYSQIIHAIHESEVVNLFIKDSSMKERAIGLLKEKKTNLERINFHIYDYADVWFRDYGPIFIVNDTEKKLAMVHWRFDAWGGKYETLMKDTVIPSVINSAMKIPCFTPGITLEGGSIDVNGKGTLLTTEQCLLNTNRNPHLSRSEIEKYLKDYLGVRHVIWLKDGIVGDDTDGHIDDIARFISSQTVVYAFEDDENDENHELLKKNFEILQNSTDQDGNKLKLVKLPMPGFIGDEEGRLPASYANFYIGNKVVLVPVFGHENDEKALRILQELFPLRKVVGINCRDLVYGLGTLHCISQQQP